MSSTLVYWLHKRCNVSSSLQTSFQVLTKYIKLSRYQGSGTVVLSCTMVPNISRNWWKRSLQIPVHFQSTSTVRFCIPTDSFLPWAQRAQWKYFKLHIIFTHAMSLLIFTNTALFRTLGKVENVSSHICRWSCGVLLKSKLLIYTKVDWV